MRLLQLAKGWLLDASSRDVAQALVAWFLVALGFMLFPFRYDYQGPSVVTNGLTRLDAGIRFDGPSVFRTKAAPVWVAPAITARELDIALDVTTARLNQRGPARILTLSDGRLSRNFMVAQKGADLLVRARRPGADQNGAPPLKVDGVFGDQERVRIDLRFSQRTIEILVDGQPRYREPLEASSLDLWNPSYRLALGDEVNGARGWDGDVHLAEAAIGGARYDLLAAPGLEHPAKFRYVPEQTRRLLRFDPSWALPVETLHVLLFAPLGALLWTEKRRRGARRLLLIACVGLTLGALFQVLKVAFPGRHPSLYHAPFNMIGTWLGALVAARIQRAEEQSPPPLEVQP